MKLILLVAAILVGTNLVNSKSLEFQQEIDDLLDDTDAFFPDDSEASTDFWLDDNDSDQDDITFDIDDITDYVDDVTDELYQLEGCSGGKCEVCFKVWKMKGCIKAEIVSDGIKPSIEIAGRKMFSRTIKGKKSFTFKISKDKLPKFLRKMLRSDIEIKISGIDYKARKFCIQLSAKLKWGGTIRWPKHGPHCF